MESESEHINCKPIIALKLHSNHVIDPNDKQLTLQLQTLVRQQVLIALNEILKKICQDKGFKFDEFQQYLTKIPDLSDLDTINTINTINTSTVPIIPENEEIDPNKCYARTASNKQCSRRKKKGHDYFCGSHEHNQPHGRIDQPLELIDQLPKKRGRPPKTPSLSENTTPIDNVTQMNVVIKIINNLPYLVDENTGNIYQKPNDFDINGVLFDPEKLNNLLVGQELPDQSIKWYSHVDRIQHGGTGDMVTPIFSPKN